MAGADWDPKDWSWSPTWLPAMNHPQPPVKPLVKHPTDMLTKSVGVNSKHQQLLQSYLAAVAELEGPQRGVLLLQQPELCEWYQQSLKAAVAAARFDADGATAAPGGRLYVAAASTTETTTTAAAAGIDGGGGDGFSSAKPCHVLVVSNGSGGLLGLWAAQAGADKVVVVEGGRYGYRAAHQLLDENKKQMGKVVGKVELAPCGLEYCWGPEVGEQQLEEQQGEAVSKQQEDEEGRKDGWSEGQEGRVEGQQQQGREHEQEREKEQHAGAGRSSSRSTAAAYKGEMQGRSGVVFRMSAAADVVVMDLFDYR